MIYLKESFDLHPASPSQRDRFVEATQQQLMPASASEGARLVAGFFAHEEWFSQIIHLSEFSDLAAFDAWRAAARSDSKLGKASRALAGFARDRREELLEPLGPVPVTALSEAIESCREKPVGVYTFAILEVDPGKMEAFESLLGGAAASLPIIAALRDLAGNPNRILDLWKGDMGKGGYAPTSPSQDAFFEPLRKIAPRERMMRLHPMPYSLLG
jgi:hypothetical protein